MIKSIFNLVCKCSLHLTLFISTIILCFIFGGCTTNQSTFYQVDLVGFQFNETAINLATNTTNSINDKDLINNNDNNNNITDIVTGTSTYSTVYVGYIGVCVQIDGQYTCTPTSNWDNLKNYYNDDFQLDSNSGNVNLLNLIHSFNQLCHPSLLIISICLTTTLFFSSFCTISKKIPRFGNIRIINCILTTLNVIIWGLGAMLQQGAISAAKNLVSISSSDQITTITGNRSCRMAWVVFVFHLIAAGLTAYHFYYYYIGLNEIEIEVQDNKIDKYI